MSRISIIGVPMDLGADRRGVDMGPSALRYSDLNDKISELKDKLSEFQGTIDSLQSSISDQKRAADKAQSDIEQIKSALNDLKSGASSSGQQATQQTQGLFDRMNGVGAHEVIIETPDHNASLANLPPKRITETVDELVQANVQDASVAK